MAEIEGKGSFTIYLEGHEGHRGNVLAHAFLSKIHRLVLILNKLERAYIEAGIRQTDFEIVDAEKYNPTTLSLKPVPKTKNYDPFPALEWGLKQIEAVGSGSDPDQKVDSEIAYDLVKLATKESETGYRNFWINGQSFVAIRLSCLIISEEPNRLKSLDIVTLIWHKCHIMKNCESGRRAPQWREGVPARLLWEAMGDGGYYPGREQTAVDESHGVGARGAAGAARRVSGPAGRKLQHVARRAAGGGCP